MFFVFFLVFLVSILDFHDPCPFCLYAHHSLVCSFYLLFHKYHRFFFKNSLFFKIDFEMIFSNFFKKKFVF